MPTQGAARIITYPAFSANVQYDGGAIQLQFIDPTGTAHVFPLPPGNATQVRDGLTKALSGVEIAQVVPTQNGEKLL